jgi:glycosyltransferase involved in cell wall biosynthesis
MQRSHNRILGGIDFPSNVKVFSVGHDEYRRLMAESCINVLALKKDLLRSSGHQTFLNAMAMGKPVIVTDLKSAQDYIENGVDGFLVPPSDSKRLREVIVTLNNNNPELAKRIGKT